MSSHTPHTPGESKPALPRGSKAPIDGAAAGKSIETPATDQKQAHGSDRAVTSIRRRSAWPRWLIRGGTGIAILAVVAYFGAPKLKRALDTVSTDDAYISSHVTFVAPRIAGQVTNVLVDDNNRVRKGDLLVQIDREPYQVQHDLKMAVVAVAQADLVATEDQVRAYVAQARSNRFRLQHAIELVDNQIAQLRAAVAAYENQEATLELARADIKRAEKLLPTKAISQEDYDRRLQQFKVGEAQVKQALEQVHQVRVGLGLPAQPAKGHLTDVPHDLDQNFSTVRQALADLLQSAAPLGIIPSSYDALPKKVIEDFYKLDPEGNLDRIYANLMHEAPLIKQAQSKLLLAKRDLAQADLNLRYCDVFAEIDGVITRRNVNPGNNVQAGQGLMAIGSLTEIWIDTNFKETQLADLRIGQRAEIEVDMYGRPRTFEGRITGFTMGTGSTLALLPPQNATGNFIKVVQRLPVRIELTDYDPDREPLFVGLSVVPYVFVKEPATGPDAGKLLQPNRLMSPAAEQPVGSTGAEP